MPREEPFFKKCCYIVPLSFCLQTWALIKMLAAFTAMMIFIFFFLILYQYQATIYGKMIIVFIVLMLIALFVDVGFDVLLIVAVCKKDIKLMKVFYCYDLYVIVTETVVFIGLLLCMFVHDLTRLIVVFIVCGVPFILLDIWTLLALKSEIIKLRNKEQYDFTRIPNCPTDIEEISVKFTSEENV